MKKFKNTTELCQTITDDVLQTIFISSGGYKWNEVLVLWNTIRILNGAE